MSTNIECAVCGSASCVDGCCAACTATGGCTHTPAPERCPDPGGCERVAGHSGLHMVRCYNCRSGQHDGITWAALRAAGGPAKPGDLAYGECPECRSQDRAEREYPIPSPVNGRDVSHTCEHDWHDSEVAAGGQEKPTGLQDYIAELRRTAQLVSPIKVAARLSAIAAAPVGGQEASCICGDAQDSDCPRHGYCAGNGHPCRCGALSAAPVGGQAEPSDAQALADAQSWAPEGEPTEAAARTLYRQHLRHWEHDWDETSEAQRTVYRGMAGDILRAAAVSGEQAAE